MVDSARVDSPQQRKAACSSIAMLLLSHLAACRCQLHCVLFAFASLSSYDSLLQLFRFNPFDPNLVSIFPRLPYVEIYRKPLSESERLNLLWCGVLGDLGLALIGTLP